MRYGIGGEVFLALVMSSGWATEMVDRHVFVFLGLRVTAACVFLVMRKGNIFGSLCPSSADAARRNGTGQVENLKGQVMPLRGWPEIESTLLGISLPHGRSALRRMLGPQQ